MQPVGVFQLRIAVNKHVGVATIFSLRCHQIRQVGLHATPVGREKFSDVQYTDGLLASLNHAAIVAAGT
jgi:hypothetical protein